MEGPVAVRATHLEGDEQADLRHHGGSDKAVYAYAAEDLSWWSDELGRDLGPAAFGENLTTLGLNLRSAVIGEQWCIGSAVLQVSEPRTPCWKLGMRLGDPALPRAFAAPDVPASCCECCARGHCKPATPSRCRRSLHTG